MLAEGKKADVIVIELDDVGFTPLVPGNRNQLYSHLAFASHGRAVSTVVIDGTLVMQDRQLLTVDEERSSGRQTRPSFGSSIERTSGRCRRSCRPSPSRWRIRARRP